MGFEGTEESVDAIKRSSLTDLSIEIVIVNSGNYIFTLTKYSWVLFTHIQPVCCVFNGNIDPYPKHNINV